MDSEEKRRLVGERMWRGCLILMTLPFFLLLGFCGWAKWAGPRSALPPEVEWDEILAFGEQAGLRDGCSFGAYRISSTTITRFSNRATRPIGWYQTPLRLTDGQYAVVGPDQQQITLYADQGTTCESATSKRLKLADRYQRARGETGNWYRIFNHGEGLILVSPRERLAWYLYFG